MPEGAEATCDVILESFDGGVMVTGTVQRPLAGCAAAAPVRSAASCAIPVRERFTEPGRRYGDPTTTRRPTRSSTTSSTSGPLVHDAVLLELPLAPLCREDCQGLCPHCGADRNEEPAAAWRPGTRVG